MVRSALKLVIGFAVAAAIAWTAYDRGGLLPMAAVLVLLLAGLLGLRFVSASRLRTDLLHDPEVSTLVFPPARKLGQPVRPPH